MKDFQGSADVFFRDNPQPMWIFEDATLRILEVNEAAITHYHYSREEFTRLTIKDLRPADELKFLNHCITSSGSSDRKLWEAIHQGKNGNPFLVQVYASPLEHDGKACWLATVQNIQQASDFKQEISEKAYQLQQVMDSSLDVICAFDKEGRFLQCSRASIEMWGYSPEELLGTRAIDLVLKEDHVSTIEASRLITRGPNTTYFQNRYVRKDGSIIPLLWSGRWDNEKEILFCIARDATEKVKAENQVKEHAQNTERILESITDGFFTVNKHWTVTYWNQVAEKLVQMPRAKILNKNLWKVFKQAVPLKFYSEYQYALKEQTSVHFEEYFPPLKLWLEVTAYPSADGLSIFFRDISSRVKVEREIKESKERYDIIAKATNDIIWDWNLITDRAIWNAAFKKILGYKTRQEYTSGAWWIQNVHPDDRERVKKSIDQAIHKAGRWKDEYRFRCADGTYKYFLDRAFVIKDSQGKAVRMIGSMQDITELKLKQEVIEQRNKQMLEIAFFNSHLVRKPLANLLGVVDLLEEHENKELMSMLKASALELDNMLKAIAEKASDMQNR